MGRLLLTGSESSAGNKKLNSALDTIHNRFGEGLILPGSLKK